SSELLHRGNHAVHGRAAAAAFANKRSRSVQGLDQDVGLQLVESRKDRRERLMRFATKQAQKDGVLRESSQFAHPTMRSKGKPKSRQSSAFERRQRSVRRVVRCQIALLHR